MKSSYLRCVKKMSTICSGSGSPAGGWAKMWPSPSLPLNGGGGRIKDALQQIECCFLL